LLVDDLLRRAAERTPAKVALVCGRSRLTFAELDAAADAIAAGLARRGVRRGARVVVHLENRAEAWLSILGILRAGAVFVVLNPTTKLEKLAFIVNDCGASVVITEPRTAASLEAARGGMPALGSIVVVVDGAAAAAPAGAERFDSLLRDDGQPRRAGSVRLDLDYAGIVYTSGSTGIPKGVVLSHANIVTAVTSITAYVRNRPEDVILNVLPLSFDYGLYQIFNALRVGATLVLEKSFAFPPVILERIGAERVTGFPIVPTIAALLVRHDLSQYDLSSLRYITSTGAVFPTPLIERLQAALPAVEIFSMYGITEAKRVSYLPPSELHARPTSVGIPMDNVEVFVADSDGRLQRRGTGELVVRGATVMQGYWGRPEETDRVLRPGLLPAERVLYTGDLFRIDDDGYLYFIARRDDVIKSRGEKVSPREVESVLLAIPGVAEAVVVGVPDPVLGHAIKAVVSPEPGATLSEQAIGRYCAQRLEDFMVPQMIEIVDVMPKTANGKIDRRELTARAQ
jgi:amino acid adenylation domain-containing protein